MRGTDPPLPVPHLPHSQPIFHVNDFRRNLNIDIFNVCSWAAVCSNLRHQSRYFLCFYYSIRSHIKFPYQPGSSEVFTFICVTDALAENLSSLASEDSTAGGSESFSSIKSSENTQTDEADKFSVYGASLQRVETEV